VPSQKLDVAHNMLVSIPDELSRLGNLKELNASHNLLPTVLVSALRGMTALTSIDLSLNCSRASAGHPMFKITSSLLTILHPGLRKLDLRQYRYRETPWPGPGTAAVAQDDWIPFKWDSASLFHLGTALSALANRSPVPILQFRM
jgi:hypothetical protein